jgi:hypothetical protein
VLNQDDTVVQGGEFVMLLRRRAGDGSARPSEGAR